MEVDGDNTDIWIWHLAREMLTQLTFDEGDDLNPLWTLDSARVVFSSDRDGGGLYWKAADGTGQVERLLDNAAGVRASSWSVDGRLVFSQSPGDIGVLAVDGERSVEMLLESEVSESQPRCPRMAGGWPTRPPRQTYRVSTCGRFPTSTTASGLSPPVLASNPSGHRTDVSCCTSRCSAERRVSGRWLPLRAQSVSGRSRRSWGCVSTNAMPIRGWSPFDDRDDGLLGDEHAGSLLDDLEDWRGRSVVESVAAGPPNWRVTAIPVDSDFPEGIDLSPDGREVWTATRNDGGISIIDVATKELVERLELSMRDPNRLRFTPDGERVLISDAEDGSLIVLDAATRRETARLDLAPNAVLIQPDGLRAYAALRGDHSVAVIDLDTLEITAQISTGPGSDPGCMFWLGAP